MIFSTASIVFASTLLASTVSAWTSGKPQQEIETFAAIDQQCDITYNISASVMTNPLTIHYVYYGTWTNAQKSIVQDFTKGLGKSAWYGMTTQYYYQKNAKSPKVYISNSVTLGKTVNDTLYSVGKTITNPNMIPSIVQQHITAKTLPEDTNALYVVLTSPDVTYSYNDGSGNIVSFCKQFCGYHSSSIMRSGKRLAYAFVGNVASCPKICVADSNMQYSPNGDVGVDGLISVLAHEISEAVTDPYSNYAPAWYDCNGNENADKCSWKFGTTTKVANYEYNMQISGRKFLIQQNWSLKTKSCSLA